MRSKQSLDFRFFLYAVAIHLVALLLLVVSVESDIFSAKKQKPQIVQATVVDRTQIEKELNQSQDAEARKQKAEQQRREADEKARIEQEKQKALAIKEAETEERRIEEEKRETAKKRKEEKKRKAEEKKRKQAEGIRRKEEEARRMIVEEKKRAEEQRHKEEAAEKQRKEEEARRKEEEEKRQAEERRRKEEAARREAEEQKKRAEEQRREDEDARRQQALLDELATEEAEGTKHLDEREINAAVAEIQDKVGQSFNKTGLPSGLTCKIRIRTVPGGEVVSAEVTKSSGNALFDRQAELAVQKASPLPVAADARVYQSYFREFEVVFKP